MRGPTPRTCGARSRRSRRAPSSPRARPIARPSPPERVRLRYRPAVLGRPEPVSGPAPSGLPALPAPPRRTADAAIAARATPRRQSTSPIAAIRTGTRAPTHAAVRSRRRGTLRSLGAELSPNHGGRRDSAGCIGCGLAAEANCYPAADGVASSEGTWTQVTLGLGAIGASIGIVVAGPGSRDVAVAGAASAPALELELCSPGVNRRFER